MPNSFEPCLCGDPDCRRCFPQYPDEEKDYKERFEETDLETEDEEC